MFIQLQSFEESLITMLPGDRCHEALEFDDLAPGTKLFPDPPASLASDLHVIRPDEGRELIALNRPVQYDDGNASLIRFSHWPGERCCLFGADDDQVHALLDELLDLRPLRQ